MAKQNGSVEKVKSMEAWIWDAACSIRGAADAAKYKDYILPLIFVKRLCDVFDDEIDRIAEKVKTRTKALQLVERDKSLVRFYMPLRPKDPESETTWDVIRTLSDKIGEQLTGILRSVAKENTSLQGIIDRIDFNATTHGQRDIDDDRLSKLIEKIAEKRLGLNDVEPDIIGRSYEYLIRKFAEGSGQSAGEFYTPAEVGFIMAKIMDAEPGMEIYDPCCGSGGLLVKCELVMEEKMTLKSKTKYAPLKLYGQEFTPATWAMSKMNMVIHDMEGDIEIGDTLKNPKFRKGGKLKTFDRIVANPMWNQGRDSLSYISDDFFINDEMSRFPAGSCGGKIDWGWMQHIYSSLNEGGRAAVILDTGAASRGSGNQGTNKEKDVRKWFVDEDLIEGVIYLPENLFYNTSAPGIVIFLNKAKQHGDKLYLLHAGKEFVKGDPKNYITEAGIERIAAAYTTFAEEEKFARLVSREEVVKNDYNISPSRYIQITDAETYRPIAEIVDELAALEEEAAVYNAELKNIFEKLGI
ncbi:type I restriction-modification system subunit M [Flavisolibacter ginsenosidimutans]|uniref:site-specific DNA-methyltransferase (adenine-specific) n=1 Tax=Flavisolibacter ginsenosidimutans TaxID=661481 RepID=A0A5B8UGV9_9BACT|nr:class I SAM-dependent DNA methyltransferase [Flavisolibacter ginsenosidimutans]QEC55339.1 SAM-dependent DNA methyltransferase [Flavisolibacter ginsenosidimutans]